MRYQLVETLQCFLLPAALDHFLGDPAKLRTLRIVIRVTGNDFGFSGAEGLSAEVRRRFAGGSPDVIGLGRTKLGGRKGLPVI